MPPILAFDAATPSMGQDRIRYAEENKALFIAPAIMTETGNAPGKLLHKVTQGSNFFCLGAPQFQLELSHGKSHRKGGREIKEAFLITSAQK